MLNTIKDKLKIRKFNKIVQSRGLEVFIQLVLNYNYSEHQPGETKEDFLYKIEKHWAVTIFENNKNGVVNLIETVGLEYVIHNYLILLKEKCNDEQLKIDIIKYILEYKIDNKIKNLYLNEILKIYESDKNIKREVVSHQLL